MSCCGARKGAQEGSNAKLYTPANEMEAKLQKIMVEKHAALGSTNIRSFPKLVLSFPKLAQSFDAVKKCASSPQTPLRAEERQQQHPKPAQQLVGWPHQAWACVPSPRPA